MYFLCEFQAGQFPDSSSSVYSLFLNDIYSWSMWDAVHGNEQVVMQLMCEGLVCILMGTVDQPSDMCQVGMRYVVCRAQGGFLGNATLVYIQQILNWFFCFFSPWNSIDVLIWKGKIEMYFKTFLDWTPEPEIHFWKSRLFSDFKIKAQTILFWQSRRIL